MYQLLGIAPAEETKAGGVCVLLESLGAGTAVPVSDSSSPLQSPGHQRRPDPLGLPTASSLLEPALLLPSPLSLEHRLSAKEKGLRHSQDSYLACNIG